MKKSILVAITLTIASLSGFSQQDPPRSNAKTKYKITIEPGIGISPMPIVDMNLSNIIQVDFSKRFSVISYSSIKENNLFRRNFNYIQSDNNLSLTQKLGIGASFFSKRSTHTVSFLAGVRHTTFRETLDHPQFDKVTVTIKSTGPDFGLMYNAKIGQKKFFFSYRMYIPLSPYPLMNTGVNTIDGNLSNISLEMGVGIRVK